MTTRVLASLAVMIVTLLAFTDQGRVADRVGSKLTVYQESHALTRSSAGPAPTPFVENRGQWPDSVLFRAQGREAAYWFTRAGIYFQVNMQPPSGPIGLRSRDFAPGNTSRVGAPEMPTPAQFEMVKMEFVAADMNAELVSSERLGARSNFILGNNPAKWRTDVPSYGRLRYNEIFPGVDLVFRGSEGQIECEMVGPQASDMAKARVRFASARPLIVDAAGVLSVEGQAGRTTIRPLVGLRFEEAGDGTYAVRTQLDRSPLSPAPASVGLFYGTYLGGGNSESAWSLFVDSSGSVYVGGYTSSVDFPTANPFQTAQGDYDAFVLKLNAQGSNLEYATYLGGGATDQGIRLKVNSSGKVYLTGCTLSADFPTLNPFQGDSTGWDAFVVKLNAAGNGLEYGTYLGGNLDDFAFGLDVDDAGNAYVAGRTTSTDFPTVNAFQADQVGRDGFVAKLNAAGNNLLYSTYLGGGGDEQIFALGLDTAGSAYVAGTTNSSDFPTQGPFQSHQGDYDGFVARLNGAGNGLVYATYIGGTLRDEAQALVVDSAGNMYLTGLTESSDFPAVNPYQTDQGDYDAFVLKFRPAGDSLLYSTYLGGSLDDYAYALTVDESGSAHVTGMTGSTDFPTVNAYQSDQGDYDAFVTRLNAAGNTVVYSTYVGGTDIDFPDAAALDPQGGLYVAGTTYSADFPTQNPYQGDQTSDDAFLVRLCADLDIDCIADAVDNCPVTYNPLQEDANGNSVGDACDVGDTLVFSLYSPVDFVITDPAGDSIGIDSVSRAIFNTILLGSTYDTLTDENSSGLTGPDGKPDDIVTIPAPLAGSYRVRIVREPDALPSDHFTEGIRINGNQQLVRDEYRDATVSALGSPEVPAEATYVTALTLPGDANADGITTSADIIHMVNYVFKSGTPPVVPGHGDVNCDGINTSADIIYLVNYVFKGGLTPCSQTGG